eukprot:3735237-Prymnesium_polylepis.1
MSGARPRRTTRLCARERAARVRLKCLVGKYARLHAVSEVRRASDVGVVSTYGRQILFSSRVGRYRAGHVTEEEAQHGERARGRRLKLVKGGGGVAAEDLKEEDQQVDEEQDERGDRLHQRARAAGRAGSTGRAGSRLQQPRLALQLAARDHPPLGEHQHEQLRRWVQHTLSIGSNCRTPRFESRRRRRPQFEAVLRHREARLSSVRAAVRHVLRPHEALAPRGVGVAVEEHEDVLRSECRRQQREALHQRVVVHAPQHDDGAGDRSADPESCERDVHLEEALLVEREVLAAGGGGGARQARSLSGGWSWLRPAPIAGPRLHSASAHRQYPPGFSIVSS